MINILRSIFLSLIGLAPFASLSIILIITMAIGPGPDSPISSYIGDNLVNLESLADAGDSYEDVSLYLFKLIRELNISLLSLTTFMTLVWSVSSHYLNIDSPGKAKIYFVHWLIFTGIFAALIFGIFFYFIQTSAYIAEQFLSGGGKTQIFIGLSILYTLMYYFGVVLGTSRFARSSVLFANKLPGNL